MGNNNEIMVDIKIGRGSEIKRTHVYHHEIKYLARESLEKNLWLAEKIVGFTSDDKTTIGQIKRKIEDSCRNLCKNNNFTFYDWVVSESYERNPFVDILRRDDGV